MRQSLPMKSGRLSSRAVALLLSLVVASPALAQQFESEVSAERFDPAPGTNNFLITRGARMDGNLRYTVGLYGAYGNESIIVRTRTVDAANSVRYAVVENMLTGSLVGSLVIIPELQVGLKVPVTWVSGAGVPGAVGQGPLREPVNTVGLGDVQLEVKGRFYGDANSPLALGAYAFFGAPTGNLTAPGTYIGNASVAGGGAVIVDYKTGPLGIAVNLGGVYREEAQVGVTMLGGEARYSLAASFEATPILRIIGDVFGSTNFSSGPATSLEGDLGIQITPISSKISVTAGGGAGILRGIGTPAARGLIGIIYDSKVLDRDGDHITDDRDACPDDPEDLDGFEDGDGCPDLDNDADGIPDSVDKCPNAAEDLDGFEDKDGCPDPDNDGDGIPDVNDHCPLEPETKNGFDDADGCPDVKDTDGDGVPDELDKCPEEPEDTDGFEDTDGCPDPDNDGDGIPDTEDECSELPEDGKGKGAEKTDGCPIDA
ncbi:MAG: hypothetical protein B6A08_12525 [Sorangiineae bacterium NIC37A_2]|nr:MAG: hypothetical protein B6A08_12525 [Sorangiineae bacterium NIC37A_2]